MRKVREFISMVNKDNDPRFNSRAFYKLTEKGEIKNHIIYVEFSALINRVEFSALINIDEEVNLLQVITVEQIELALVDKTLIFREMVNKFFDFVKWKYGDVITTRK